MIPFEIGRYLENAYVIIIFLMSLTAYTKWSNYKANALLHGNNTNMPLLVAFCLVVASILGFRTISGVLFVDTANYAELYKAENLYVDDITIEDDEWLFAKLIQLCRPVMDASGFFTVISIGYFFFALWGVHRLCRNNTYIGMLFFLGAFSTLSYATNGIRNGLACSIMIAAISFLIAEKRSVRETIIGAVLCFAAFSIHKSTMLPIVCVVASLFMKNVKVAYRFWLFSILLYLVAKGPIESFFTGLGFDDRLTNYAADAEEYAAQGFKSGFRIDFLLYSFMPIWLGIYVCFKRGIKNITYQRLLVTYILANSFWVMMMGAAYSNRFAYLSWFLYPLVLGYPCLRLDVWDNRQGIMAMRILMAQIGFTMFMTFIY